MTAAVFVLTIAGFVLALLATPSRALAIYCAGLLLYPQVLTVAIGTIDFSVSRILIIAVLANAVIRRRLHRSFQWSWMDTFVAACYVLGSVSLLHTFGTRALERRSGTFFDTLLPYFATRLMITKEDDLIAVAKALALIAVPLVGIALYQVVTGQNPLGDFSAYYLGPEDIRVEDSPLRLGLHRPGGTFTHPIALGLACAMIAPLTWCLRYCRVWPAGVLAALATFAYLGVFASLSSGPWIAGLVSAFVLLAYARPRVAAGLAIACSFLLAGYVWQSDQPSADTLATLALNPEKALYRVGLIQEALGGGMNGHWLTGYGYVGVGPGSDNTFFHWEHQDLVNVYIQVLVRTGLLGLIPYLFANAAGYIRLIQSMLIAATPRATWLALGVLATVLGWNAAMMTVGTLSQTLQLLYIAFAMSENMPVVVVSGLGRAR
jgi:hypothetical protein